MLWRCTPDNERLICGKTTVHTVYLGLGSNLGNRKENIDEAVRKISGKVGVVERRSSNIETEPWGFDSPNRFVNAAVKCLTELSPRKVLEATQAIEREMGRTEKSADGCYHDRIIDIDILIYDDITVDEADLKIPHPLIAEREFVLKPLKEIM